MSSPVKSPSSKSKFSRTSVGSDKLEDNKNAWKEPDFIYGGPFIQVDKPNPFLDTGTPINIQLQGTFKKSFAYQALSEKKPVVLTKIIDYLARDGSKIKGASSDDVSKYMKHVAKLKNDLVTNKEYTHLTADTPDVPKWNEWIDSQENKHFFTNTWLFSECYIYRRLREGCQLYKSLVDFDPFEQQKNEAFHVSLEPMCIVADKLVGMLPPSAKDQRKADFITLLKIGLWANKCDLALTVGEQILLTGKEEAKDVVDPFQMIIDLKDKVLADDSNKIADQVVTKAENITKAIEGKPEPAPEPSKGSVTPSPPAVEGEGEEPPKIPCPAKVTIPSCVMFDIICDNAGYELFSDLCIAHFLVSQKIVQKVRFHVKNMPWFVSDVTPRDFTYVIDQCKTAKYDRTVAAEPKPEGAEGAEEPPRIINSDKLNELGQQWADFVGDGTFVVLSEDYWTYPWGFRWMKKHDPALYRTLQFPAAILFKGDLNYRKLLDERNCNPMLGFEPALQGFLPAPIIALRTVKSDLVCGLPKGKWEQLNGVDPHWMRKGDYGVIQFCGKSEALKVSDRPCAEYGARCFGEGCPDPQK